MPWVKVPAENRPLFYAALPDDARVETVEMFGGVAAKVNGNLFAGLFGRSTMVWLAEPDRGAALALDGASLFDPMGNGRVRSDKVMLPESVMGDASKLRGWITRAFVAAALLPKKAAKGTSPPRAKKAAKGASARNAKKTASVKKSTAKRKKAASGRRRA